MIINIYVNWEERKIYTYEDFVKAITKEVEENLDDWGEEWLWSNYTSWELFNLQDSEKAEIEQEMKDELIQDTINDCINYEWDVIRIKI